MDAETRAYLDAFRLEFRSDLAGVREELRRDLAEAIATSRQANRADLAEVRTELAQEITAVREASRADLAEAMATLRTEIRSEATETRRHFDVVAEGLRSDIRLVAEGVVANTESIERLRSDMGREMDERLRVVHLAIGELRDRIR